MGLWAEILRSKYIVATLPHDSLSRINPSPEFKMQALGRSQISVQVSGFSPRDKMETAPFGRYWRRTLVLFGFRLSGVGQGCRGVFSEYRKGFPHSMDRQCGLEIRHRTAPEDSPFAPVDLPASTELMIRALGALCERWKRSCCGTLKRPPYTPGQEMQVAHFKELKCYNP